MWKLIMNLSKRNIPLIYQRNSTVPIITVENYEKWYDIYIVFPDGEVQTIPMEILEDIIAASKIHVFGDHIYHPIVLHKIAEIYCAEVDYVSENCVTGRWISEYKQIQVENV